MIVQEPIQAAIWHCLNHYHYKDAVFLAERLCSEVMSDETIFILATSYYRSNLIHQAYWLLKEKSRRSARCRFLQAKCAYELAKYSEAECALTNSGGFGDLKNFEGIIRDFGEIACFALRLISHICIKTERNKIAAEALRQALKLNPFLWFAFADLCQLGEQVDVNSVFQITSAEIFNTSQNNSNSMLIFGENGNFYEIVSNDNNSNTTDCESLETTDKLENSINSYYNFLLSTPTEQIPQSSHPSHPTNQNINTPNKKNNYLNSTLSVLRGVNNPNEAENICSKNTNIVLDDGIVRCTSEQVILTSKQTFDSGTGNPCRKQLKYLSTVSPVTPSFGILPINSPCSADTSLIGCFGAVNFQTYNTTSSPSTQTLVETNQEQKVSGKRLKGYIANVTQRKEDSSNSGSKKHTVFTQSGNLSPRTPNNTGGNAAVRRSSRIFSNNAYSVKENNKSPTITSSKFLRPRTPPRKSKTRMEKICLANDIIMDEKLALSSDKNFRKEKVETITSATCNKMSGGDSKVLFNNSYNNAQTMLHHVTSLKKQSAEGLMALLRDLGEGYKLLSKYNCQATIKHFQATIPKHHYCCSWVQSLVGLSYYELREYETAVAIFKQIHEMEPYRLEYMEIYSSSLWHLQKEVELSVLAQDLMNQDKTSPVTWCVSGNCFSLHKEHETAIKFFKRAVQVDPEFVYSYTLLGHELVLTEDLDKAMDYFRAAVIRDPRHYNAWFGIGTIYSKQEKYELAELHYIKALKINPQNSVILVHIGAMQYFMQKKELALETLNTAAILDPKNPLARFHRGSIYFSLGKHQDALRELEELKEIVPKESVVFYLMGKIHKALGNIDSALMHFSWATDLDPKGANNQIKDAFDSMSLQSGCTNMNNLNLEGDFESISERSDDSTQAQQDINYDSDVY